MREILFRGKRVDNGEWVEGSHVEIKDGRCFIIPPKSGTFHKSPYIPYKYLIHPESVGQFTGLLDKNGKKIFERDVLKLTYDGYSFNCEVKFNDGGFLVYHDNGFNGGDADMTMIGWLKHDDYQFEIIGNIHDNTELLYNTTTH